MVSLNAIFEDIDACESDVWVDASDGFIGDDVSGGDDASGESEPMDLDSMFR